MVAVETNMAKLASYLVNHIFSVFTSMWSVGMWSVGMWSVGMWSVGMWSVGMWSVGMWSVGMWSVGMWSVGMWSVGILVSCIVHIRNNMDILSLDLEIRVCIT